MSPKRAYKGTEGTYPAQKEIKNRKKMTIKISLDNITTIQHKILFYTERLQEMLSNVKEYSNNNITYNDFSKRMERNKFTFMNSKGNGVGKIVVSDVSVDVGGGSRWIFIY